MYVLSTTYGTDVCMYLQMYTDVSGVKKVKTDAEAEAEEASSDMKGFEVNYM